MILQNFNGKTNNLVWPDSHQSRQ